MAVARPRAGRDYPRDWSEFLKLFSSEEDCFDYLERVRWGKGFNCPHCGAINAPYWRMGDGRRRCRLGRQETTVTAGTIFRGTRKDLRLWFAAIWQVVNAKTGASALTSSARSGSGATRLPGPGSTSSAGRWFGPIAICFAAPSKSMRPSGAPIWLHPTDRKWCPGGGHLPPERATFGSIEVAITGFRLV